MNDLLSIFPRASKSCQEANPAILTLPDNKNDFTEGGGKKRHQMNKTEAEFALILEAMKRKGEILRYEYEGITLRWADMRYTPDFIVFNGLVDPMIKLIEIKGGHIW